MDDLDILKELEKEIGQKLEKRPYKSLANIKPGYSLDSEGKLIGLNLHQIQLNRYPETLSRLQNLQTLNLSFNQLTDLIPEITELELEIKWGNDITGGIFLSGNPLQSPPIEVVKQGRAAVRNYFRQIAETETEKTVSLYEARLLIVGQGGVGKTCLLNKLMAPEFEIAGGESKTTEGVDIHPWDIQIKHMDREVNFRVNFWDFGGQEIYHSTLEQLPHIGDKLPKVWVDIRRELEVLNEDYISYDRFLEICARHKLDEERAAFLSDYYHDLGVILRFRDSELLENTVILRPEWGTGAVNDILDDPEVRESRGRFDREIIPRVWGKYPRDKRPFLLKLMEKFELCFPLGEKSGTGRKPGGCPGIRIPVRVHAGRHHYAIYRTAA